MIRQRAITSPLGVKWKHKSTGEAVIEFAYTQKRLERCINYSDLINDKTLLNYANRWKAAGCALAGINAGNLFKTNLNEINIRGKSAYKCSNIEQTLATRLVSQNIRANYKIRQQNRNIIIKNLISFLKESGPYQVFRFDIEAFFESINRDELSKRLINDGRCSRQTILLLSQLFEGLGRQGVTGLPRGLSLSSTLSEYALHEFDAAIKQEDNIFFYARFVDDIILITSPELHKTEVIKLLESNIFPGLNLHKSGKKVSHHSVPKSGEKDNKPEQKSHCFDYLGYQFSIFEKNDAVDKILGLSRRRVDIDISQEKIDKLSARIITSFTSYISSASSPDAFDLLENRIKALTGNYIIRDPVTGIRIKTGVYYNYADKNDIRDCPLKKLDALLRGLLFSRHHKLSAKVQTKISLNNRRKLVGYTFSGGFHNRRLHFFSNADLKRMKEAWQK